VILGLFWGFLGWACLFAAIKAARACELLGCFVCICLAMMFAEACAQELVVSLLVSAVEAAGR
jgi:hypothetical protein